MRVEPDHDGEFSCRGEGGQSPLGPIGVDPAGSQEGGGAD
jgi:hypothetical protein